MKRKIINFSQIHRKLEDDECFDYGCTHESKWKIIYTDRENSALRVETRLCEAHSDEFLPTLKRPWAIVGLRP